MDFYLGLAQIVGVHTLLGSPAGIFSLRLPQLPSLPA